MWTIVSVFNVPLGCLVVLRCMLLLPSRLLHLCFLNAGKHPLIENTVEDNASSALKPLPNIDHNRPHVFIDVSQRAGVSGRIVVELFEDMFPALCAAFRNRCHEVREPEAHAYTMTCFQAVEWVCSYEWGLYSCGPEIVLCAGLVLAGKMYSLN